ncbi:hypothetical protein HanIR_Chr14g0703131 [Helianthus annuus]|nr:hypothetical protein HanIR_Chr14g0703131 [Helianthus annuus]
MRKCFIKIFRERKCRVERERACVAEDDLIKIFRERKFRVERESVCVAEDAIAALLMKKVVRARL